MPSSLPPEVLNIIFERAVDSVPSLTEAPTNVSQTCRIWREIAIANTELWRHMFFNKPCEMRHAALVSPPSVTVGPPRRASVESARGDALSASGHLRRQCTSRKKQHSELRHMCALEGEKNMAVSVGRGRESNRSRDGQLASAPVCAY